MVGINSLGTSARGECDAAERKRLVAGASDDLVNCGSFWGLLVGAASSDGGFCGGVLACTTMLLLFDIDGTLLSGPIREHSKALRTALQDVHGLSETDAGIPVEEAGRTDGQIVRSILTTAGVGTTAIDALVADVQTAACRHYEALCPPDLTAHVIPGMSELLASLSARPGIRLSLVTGNFEAIARLKLDRAGLGSWFATGQGGFGSDAEDRDACLPLHDVGPGATACRFRENGRSSSATRRGTLRAPVPTAYVAWL